MKVAEQLSAHDRLGAHLKDELGIDGSTLARPLQAAWISAVSFALFALVPIFAMLVSPPPWRLPAIAVSSLVSLGVLGAFGSHLGGAPAQPRGTAGDGWRRCGDGGDGRHRPAARRLRGLTDPKLTSDPGVTRTRNRRLRRPMLYPVELRGHSP